MKKFFFLFLLLCAVNSIHAQIQGCECKKYPYTPSKCADVCFKRLLSSFNSPSSIEVELGVTKNFAEKMFEWGQKKEFEGYYNSFISGLNVAEANRLNQALRNYYKRNI